MICKGLIGKCPVTLVIHIGTLPGQHYSIMFGLDFFIIDIKS